MTIRRQTYVYRSINAKAWYCCWHIRYTNRSSRKNKLKKKQIKKWDFFLSLACLTDWPMEVVVNVFLFRSRLLFVSFDLRIKRETWRTKCIKLMKKSGIYIIKCVFDFDLFIGVCFASLICQMVNIENILQQSTIQREKKMKIFYIFLKNNSNKRCQKIDVNKI